MHSCCGSVRKFDQFKCFSTLWHPDYVEDEFLINNFSTQIIKTSHFLYESISTNNWLHISLDYLKNHNEKKSKSEFPYLEKSVFILSIKLKNLLVNWCFSLVEYFFEYSGGVWERCRSLNWSFACFCVLKPHFSFNQI